MIAPKAGIRLRAIDTSSWCRRIPALQAHARVRASRSPYDSSDMPPDAVHKHDPRELAGPVFHPLIKRLFVPDRRRLQSPSA